MKVPRDRLWPTCCLSARDGATRAVEAKREQLLELVASVSGAGTVYAATVADVERVYRWLIDEGESVSRYHVRRDATDGRHQRVRHGYR